MIGSRISFSLAFPECRQPSAAYLTRVESSNAGVLASELRTLPSLLRQLPAVRRLDINLSLFGRERIVPVYLYDERREKHATAVFATAEGSRPEQTCQIRELVVCTGDNVGLLALTLPLPCLTTLHISDLFDISVGPVMDRYADYLGLFCHLGTALDVWPSLLNFHTCLRVTIASAPGELEIWNLWVRSLFPSQCHTDTDPANRP
jgi:hypothetical protein